MRTGSAAVAWAAAQHYHPTRSSWHNDCLLFVRSAFAVGSLYSSAERGFYGTRYRHTTTPPAGVPVWWTNGAYGHVAMSAGGGYVWSNDILRDGKIDKVKISYITARWGQHYRGWSEDINGVRVYSNLPAVSLAAVADAARRVKAGHRPIKVSNGSLLKKALAAEVGRGSMLLSNSYLGAGFVKQYAALQRKWYPDTRADGIPGSTSLVRLTSRHRMAVR